MAPGFDRRFTKAVSVDMPNTITVDLHRTLVLGPFGISAKVNELFQNDRHCQIGGRPVRILSQEHAFVHACMHAALGDWPPRLVPLRDVGQFLIAADLDLEQVFATAHRWRVEAPVTYAISEANRRFGPFDTPAVRWAQDTRPGVIARQALCVSNMLCTHNSDQARQFLVVITIGKGISEQLRRFYNFECLISVTKINAH